MEITRERKPKNKKNKPTIKCVRYIKIKKKLAVLLFCGQFISLAYMKIRTDFYLFSQQQQQRRERKKASVRRFRCLFLFLFLGNFWFLR